MKKCDGPPGGQATGVAAVVPAVAKNLTVEAGRPVGRSGFHRVL